MAWRLARFNTLPHHSSLFSMGVPAPAGALLILSPMITSFVFEVDLSVWVHGITALVTSILLVSRYPTFVFKKIVIPQNLLGIFCMCVVGVVAGIFSAPWETLLFLSITYIAFLPISGYWFYKKGLS
jgi:CDP-diacylglycerol--serine O-phosphatidyltransferase